MFTKVLTLKGLLFLDVRTMPLFISIFKLAKFSLYIDVCKYIINAGKMTGAKNLIASILLILTSFIWKRYGYKMIKSSIKLMHITIICICSFYIGYLFDLFTSLHILLFIDTIYSSKEEYVKLSIFKIRIEKLNKKDVEVLNTNTSLNNNISIILCSLLMIVIDIPIFIIISLFIISALANTIIQILIYRKYLGEE